MSEDEIINHLKDLKENLEPISNSFDLLSKQAIQGILDLYNEEKRKNEYLNWYYEKQFKSYIHKDKIKEKIDKLESLFHFYAGRDPYEWDDSEFDGDRCDTLSQQIKVLKELLEGEE